MSTQDQELAAMAKVNEALTSLEPIVQQRILRWAADRFGVTISIKPILNRVAAGETREHEEGNDGLEETKDFASFFERAKPATDADRALVVGYWLQVIRGNAD